MTTFAFIGLLELLIVLAIALVVIGGTRLPRLGRHVGSSLRELRRATDRHLDRDPDRDDERSL
jgi:TatA/E family protein of Tat protein translocase